MTSIKRARSTPQTPERHFGTPVKTPATIDDLKTKRNSARMSSPGTPRGSKMVNDTNSVRVIARFRPETDSERSNSKNGQVMKIINDELLVCKEETYTFDKVFGPDSSQSDVFQYSVTQTVDDLFEGYNGTVLAYGQTGSGKSYTMMGPDITDQDKKGLIPRITDLLFEKIQNADVDIEYTLSASYMEIYLEQIKDLINPEPRNLTVLEDSINGIHVRGLSKVYVSSAEEFYEVLAKGGENRTTAATNMNEESSRSHAIFQVNLNQESPEFGVKRSKLFLVDLAGSEKVSKTGVSGLNLEEAKKINSSLSSLGNVINALTDPKATHIPYRISKLTRILQESLGGNSRTSLIVNCSPSVYNEAETVSTLRFGTRAKKIKNKAHVNNDPCPSDLVNQINQLKKINEEQLLQNQAIQCELELWKTGVYKFDSGVEGSISSLESDFKSKSTVLETPISSAVEIDHLKERVERLSEILTKVPSLKGGDDEIEQKFRDSQKLNDELMADIKEQCAKNVDLSLQVECMKDQRKPETAQTNIEKTLALETTLELFTIKLQELETQNNVLRREISTIKSISETRNERIQTLESTIKSYKLQADPKDTSVVENSVFSLRNPFNLFSKTQSNHERTSSETPSNPRKFEEDFQCGNAVDFTDGDDRRLSEADTSLSSDSYTYSSLSKENKVILNQNRKRSDRSSFHSANSCPRMGLNLHIVKPLRGGSTVVNES